MTHTRCLRSETEALRLVQPALPTELAAHVAGCDTCRDARHDLETLAARLAVAGDDFEATPSLAERLAEIAEEDAAGVEPAPAAQPIASVTRAPVTHAPAKSRRTMWLLLAACASVAASTAVGFRLADKQKSPSAAATRSWHGKVAKVARSGADTTGGLFVSTPSGKTALGEGAEIKEGMHLSTDGRTRAKLTLDDGSQIVVDRASELTIESTPRTVLLEDGAILADVAHVEAAPSARIRTRVGEVKVLGTKLAVTAASDRTNVEVLRGEVELLSAGSPASSHVSAGQEGVVGRDGKIDVAPANDLAQRAAFGEELVSTHNEDAEAPASGLGELRARRPGRPDEKDRAVRLQKHAVKVRIAGNVARTEIDEVFANDTDDELEGIYRFPLPPGAQIERLALEVDGKLVDGEFIDKAKASAIWRGAIQNAAPRAPKPREEIVWVPGPWHDPALLEWQRGGRFELRIFPIPKRGSRRVVISYTETVAPVSGVRRYVYPLPQGSSSKITIDEFALDAQVLGHDPKSPVRVRGYELARANDGAGEQLRTTMRSFSPSGDLAIEYALDDRATDMTAWAYTDAASTAPVGAKKELDPIGTDPFVALALRPKLPRWADSKPRDQVIVVDAGRAMFGERFARAKRLAVQMAQEMDRRDRLTVLACDVTCRTLPGGFVAPGAPSAHDVDAFLASVTPDGASDLVSAVRAAAHVGGHEAERDLRISLVSDGVATAGYRSSSRVAKEVTDALADPRAEVVTVPLGADADVALLGEIARGGGGVVVPYQPGQRLEASALEVLNATYGTTLRDVELVLPDGLRDTTPAILPALRAGSETVVTARMRGDSVKGDVVLRGKVGGEPFEARYPLDVRATTERGNAFVPRLFAAARIADRERERGEAGKAELVALSRRFSVPSKYTSLLVLESEAMFQAFGIERSNHGTAWTGESVAQGASVASLGLRGKAGDDEAEGALSSLLGEAAKKDTAEKSDDGALARGPGAGGGGFAGVARSAPAPTMAPPPAAAPKVAATDAMRNALEEDVPRDWSGRRRGGRFMKKVWVRRSSIVTDATPSISADKVAAARTAVAAAPDERGRHKELAKALALSGQLDELGEVLEKWSARDPLDADVIVSRADLAARRGDRDTAIRILGGALSASALSSRDAFVLSSTIARSLERAGKSEACVFRVSAAELQPTDAESVARAVSCERAQGRARSADRWLEALKPAERTAVDAALSKVDTAKPEAVVGDIVVSATWDGGGDVDLAVLDPSGRRAAAITRLPNARVEGLASRDHETLALSSSEAGAFAVEVVRANAADHTPVTGKVTIRAFGQSQTVPFTLAGPRVQIGRVDVRWESELVPVDDEFGFVSPERPFDRAAVTAVLQRVSVAHCGRDGVSGTGRVVVTYQPGGNASSAVVQDGVFSGSSAASCISQAFLRTRVPPFSGSAVQVGKSFSVAGR